MGFSFGDIAETKDHGVLRGIQREIACECWFTSKGKSIPRLIKVMDQEGVLHTIREIQVLTTEEKNYCGIQTVEHLCQIHLFGKKTVVKLVYTKEDCRWTILEV